MNQLAEFLCIAFLVAPATGNAQSVLTFDELPTPQVIPGLNYATNIPNGYGGLQWNNFGVLDGSIRSAGEGYHAGMVSPNNVAFDLRGSPASISVAGGLFDLNSAYLTLALNLDTAFNIRVQGFVATTVLYDNIYTVYRITPTLINFDYFGVDRVTFIPSPAQHFAMDNLAVTVPEPSTIGLLILGAVWGGVGGLIKRRNIETGIV